MRNIDVYNSRSVISYKREMVTPSIEEEGASFWKDPATYTYQTLKNWGLRTAKEWSPSLHGILEERLKNPISPKGLLKIAVVLGEIGQSVSRSIPCDWFSGSSKIPFSKDLHQSVISAGQQLKKKAIQIVKRLETTSDPEETARKIVVQEAHAIGAKFFEDLAVIGQRSAIAFPLVLTLVSPFLSFGTWEKLALLGATVSAIAIDEAILKRLEGLHATYDSSYAVKSFKPTLAEALPLESKSKKSKRRALVEPTSFSKQIDSIRKQINHFLEDPATKSYQAIQSIVSNLTGRVSPTLQKMARRFLEAPLSPEFLLKIAVVLDEISQKVSKTKPKGLFIDGHKIPLSRRIHRCMIAGAQKMEIDSKDLGRLLEIYEKPWVKKLEKFGHKVNRIIVTKKLSLKDYGHAALNIWWRAVLAVSKFFGWENFISHAESQLEKNRNSRSAIQELRNVAEKKLGKNEKLDICQKIVRERAHYAVSKAFDDARVIALRTGILFAVSALALYHFSIYGFVTELALLASTFGAVATHREVVKRLKPLYASYDKNYSPDKYVKFHGKNLLTCAVQLVQDERTKRSENKQLKAQ